MTDIPEDPGSNNVTPHKVLLTVRALNCLSWRFQTDKLVPGEVAKLTAAQILSIPNSGKRTLDNVREWLAACGLTLSVSGQQFDPTMEKRLEYLEKRVEELERRTFGLQSVAGLA